MPRVPSERRRPLVSNGHLPARAQHLRTEPRPIAIGRSIQAPTAMHLHAKQPNQTRTETDWMLLNTGFGRFHRAPWEPKNGQTEFGPSDQTLSLFTSVPRGLAGRSPQSLVRYALGSSPPLIARVCYQSRQGRVRSERCQGPIHSELLLFISNLLSFINVPTPLSVHHHVLVC
jgi:hypothetical protein